ncbi:MAG: KpsF/GutQ family sugar-phosphate isomerase [Myxococcota bacterium]|nr:KpsF/GutQ family sugar-phosphate isomerase [Myxococcota bacterium]
MANSITSNKILHLNRSKLEKDDDLIIGLAREVFIKQSDAIANLARRMSADFMRAIGFLIDTKGHVIVSGMGKSGLIGRKIAATFSSTGTPSFFVHPAEAYHGDLGMITKDDTMILLSNSGETEEIVRLIPFLRRMQIPIVSLVGKVHSSLAEHSDAAIDASVDSEVCPNNLAPMNSCLATMAIGDALAVSLMRKRDFKPQDFARLHPGGSLGRRLLTKVRDVMRADNLPIVSAFQSIRESLVTMTTGRLGLVLVVEGEKLLGIVTDGDLRRALQDYNCILDFPISRIMTPNPKTVGENVMLVDAEKLMKKEKIKALVVVNSNGKVSGVLEIFDN